MEKMETIKNCLKIWSDMCFKHMYSFGNNEELASVTCNVPCTLFDKMTRSFSFTHGFLQNDNDIPFNVISLHQMADKATDVSLIPNICTTTECLISEIYVKASLSDCIHGAYANNSNNNSNNIGTQYSVLILLILLVVFT